MDVNILISAFIFGLIFGSFFNVVAYRLPKGLSLVRPGSYCPKCEQHLSAAELIPVFSYLFQRGKCKSCGELIHWRYPVVELITGVGFLLIFLHSTSFGSLIAGLVFFSVLLVLTLIDFDYKILPNSLTLPGILFGLIFSLLNWTIPFWTSLLGAALGFFIIFLIALLSKGGMGMGDAKLLAMIGTFLGWKGVFYVLFGASILGSIGGITYLLITKQDWKTPIPFGPSLALAALLAYFFKS